MLKNAYLVAKIGFDTALAEAPGARARRRPQRGAAEDLAGAAKAESWRSPYAL